MSEDTKEKKQMNVVLDGILTLPMAGLGLFLGGCAALFYPTGFWRALNNDAVDGRKNRVDKLHDISADGNLFTGYWLGMAGIAAPIVNNPSNPESYILAGIATVAGTANCIYEAGKKKGLEEKI